MGAWFHRVILAFILGCVVISPGSAAEDDGSQVKILRPQHGAVVQGDTLELEYDLIKGHKAAHAHVYLDGTYQKGFTGSFKNLAPGKHEIRVVASTKDHTLLAAQASVTIEVQTAGETGY